MDTNATQRRRGPIPGPETVKATILIEPDLLDWGKRRPGGLSELVRRLLREEKERGSDTPAFMNFGTPEEEVADEAEWQRKFARDHSKLAELGAEAIEGNRRGLTTLLDEFIDG